MTNNKQSIDDIFESLQNKQPRLRDPKGMTDAIMRRIEQESKPAKWIAVLRYCSIAASILLLIVFTFQMTRGNTSTDEARIIAYQNETVCKTQPIKDENLYISYIQKKLYKKSSYELLKKKIYESKY